MYRKYLDDIRWNENRASLNNFRKKHKKSQRQNFANDRQSWQLYVKFPFFEKMEKILFVSTLLLDKSYQKINLFIWKNIKVKNMKELSRYTVSLSRGRGKIEPSSSSLLWKKGEGGDWDAFPYLECLVFCLDSLREDLPWVSHPWIKCTATGGRTLLSDKKQ